MKRLAAAGGIWLFGAGVAAGATPTDEIERAIFDHCALVLQQQVRIDDPSSISRLGYRAQPADEEGLWALKSFPAFTIRIGVGQDKPGCRLRFHGTQAAKVYESVLIKVQSHGYKFVNGQRAAPEPQFVMDTLASNKKPIGVVSMFRINSADATSFAMTLFP